ncbi:hypothetical protein WCU61_16355 [Pectobacterium versatile]|uniref:hypothetical protein n=1 Tax=Pectobacterium versatile TaxID=2488639 RepID=UPI003018ACA8
MRYKDFERNEYGIVITPFEYDKIKKISLSIINELSHSWPVIFIGVGRTPTPLMAFIECYLGSSHVLFLPLSGFRHNYPGEDIPLLREPLSSENISALFRHFRRFIPTEILIEKNTLVILDFVDSGASLAAASYHIKKYLHHEGIACHISVAAIYSSTLPACFVETMNRLAIDYHSFSIPKDDSVLSNEIFRLGRGDYYNAISPFNREFKISVGHRTEELIKYNKPYYDYMNQLAEFMIKDVNIEFPIIGGVYTLFNGEGCVEKHCSTYVDAITMMRQFNSFPFHVNSKVDSNVVSYKFITGDTFEQAILARRDNVSTLINNFAHILGCVHWDEPILISNYEQLCEERLIYKSRHVVGTTHGYFSRIHGDLHLGNIVVTKDDDIFFIDRLRQCGDVMFDFPFILSLLCFYQFKKDDYFYTLVINFFSIYERYVDDKDNFYRAFLVNFINYSRFVSVHQKHFLPKFPESKYAAKLSQLAVHYKDFKAFIEALCIV